MTGNPKRSLVFMAAFASFAVLSLKRPTAAQVVDSTNTSCGPWMVAQERVDGVICSTTPVITSTSTPTNTDGEGGCCG